MMEMQCSTWDLGSSPALSPLYHSLVTVLQQQEQHNRYSALAVSSVRLSTLTAPLNGLGMLPLMPASGSSLCVCWQQVKAGGAGKRPITNTVSPLLQVQHVQSTRQWSLSVHVTSAMESCACWSVEFNL